MATPAGTTSVGSGRSRTASTAAMPRVPLDGCAPTQRNPRNRGPPRRRRSESSAEGARYSCEERPTRRTWGALAQRRPTHRRMRGALTPARIGMLVVSGSRSSQQAWLAVSHNRSTPCNRRSRSFRSPRAHTGGRSSSCRTRCTVSEPHWIPPLRRDEYRRLSPTHNPFWEHARADLWIARSGGRITGRIAAIEDRLYNERQGEPIDLVRVFRSGGRRNVRRRFSRRSSGALVEWNSRVVRGPVNPSLNDSAGLLDRRVRRRSVHPDAL